MASSTRLIRRRIKSVANTGKITKAMELVAASKMRKAVSAVLATRPYADAAWRAIREMAKVTDPTAHPLLRRNTGAGKILVVVFSSDRGLCGGFNSQLVRAVAQFLGTRIDKIDLLTVGRKGQDALRRRGGRIVATFTELANNPTFDATRPIADLAIRDFTAGAYDAVHVAYTDYRSALTQKPTVSQLLPVVRIDGLGEVNDAIQGIEKSGASAAGSLVVNQPGYEFVFEPSPEQVLDLMLPRLVEAQIYQALLESSASEHAARMMAMRTASDSAADMLSALTLTYNQARQAGITREIAEISSGKAALEN